jgi:hypothetical protein
VPCQLAKTVAAFFPKVLMMDEARRIASNIAKLPTLLSGKCGGSTARRSSSC